MGRVRVLEVERRYEVACHARDRLAERYGVRLTHETWDALAREIEDWPHVVTDTLPNGTEHRVAQVQVQGPDGSRLVLPIAYIAGPRKLRIMTVNPGGASLGRVE